MADITLENIGSGYNIGTINVNFERIQDALNDDILHVRGGNATMYQHLDMNGFRILNADGIFGEGEGGITQEDADLRYVNVTGDTMTGALLVQIPTLGSEPVRYDMFQVLDGQVDVVAADLDAAETSITNLQAGLTAVEGDITVLEGSVSTLQGNVTSILSSISTLEGDVSTLETDLLAVDARISNVVGETAVHTGNYTITAALHNVMRETSGTLTVTIPHHTNENIVRADSEIFMHHIRHRGAGVLTVVGQAGVVIELPRDGANTLTESGQTITIQRSTTGGSTSTWFIYGQTDAGEGGTV